MKIKSFAIAATLTAASMLFSVKIAYSIGEQYFFDKLFYQKSALHGYVKDNDFSLSNLENNYLTKKRITDLSLLFSGDQNKVLGATRNDEAFVVVVIGDSMTYGQGVKKEEVFTQILSTKLNKINKAVVYNLAVPGDDFIDNYLKYQRANELLSPDLFIFTLVDNDLAFIENGRYPMRDEYKKQLTVGCFQPEMTIDWRDIEWAQQINEYYFPSISEEFANHCLFENGIGIIDKEKTIFASFDSFEPSDFEITSESDYYQKLAHIMNYFRSVVIKNQGYFVNNKKYNFEVKVISENEGHLSKESHQEFSEILFQEITNHELWKNK